MRALVLIGVTILGACIWPIEPAPQIPLEFQGRVLSPTRAPVAGAEVRVWGEPLARADSTTPLATGRTDADGRFSLARTVRSQVAPAVLTLRVIPPAASGLATMTVSGLYSDVFSDYAPIGSGGYRYHTEVVLERAP